MTRWRWASLFPWLLVGHSLLVGACATRSHPAPVYEADDQDEAREESADETPVAPSAVAPRRVRQPFLWVVRAGDFPSALFGTIHLGVGLDEALSEQRRRNLRDARTFVLELDPAAVDPQELMRLARSGGQRLDARLAPTLWHDLSNELHTTLRTDELAQMRPWFAMIALTRERAVAMQRDPPEPMDVALARFARRHGVSLRPLETPAQQIEAFASVPDEEMLAALRDMVGDSEAHRRELEAIYEAYRQGDEPAMTRLLFEPNDIARSPELYAALFYRRNDAWMAAVREEIDRGAAFVAVGLGHLLGPEGLVARLRNAGYDVQRIGAY